MRIEVRLKNVFRYIFLFMIVPILAVCVMATIVLWNVSVEVPGIITAAVMTGGLVMMSAFLLTLILIMVKIANIIEKDEVTVLWAGKSKDKHNKLAKATVNKL